MSKRVYKCHPTEAAGSVFKELVKSNGSAGHIVLYQGVMTGQYSRTCCAKQNSSTTVTALDPVSTAKTTERTMVNLRRSQMQLQTVFQQMIMRLNPRGLMLANLESPLSTLVHLIYSIFQSLFSFENVNSKECDNRFLPLVKSVTTV